MSKPETIICWSCGRRRLKPPDDGKRYRCPHRICSEHSTVEQASKPLTVKVSITGESSFDIDLGWDGDTDVRFLVGVMLQAGKTLGEELKKHGASPEAVDAAIRRIDILELQEGVQKREG